MNFFHASRCNFFAFPPGRTSLSFAPTEIDVRFVNARILE
jgi:hypothetical protein